MLEEREKEEEKNKRKVGRHTISWTAAKTSAIKRALWPSCVDEIWIQFETCFVFLFLHSNVAFFLGFSTQFWFDLVPETSWMCLNRRPLAFLPVPFGSSVLSSLSLWLLDALLLVPLALQCFSLCPTGSLCFSPCPPGS